MYFIKTQKKFSLLFKIVYKCLQKTNNIFFYISALDYWFFCDCHVKTTNNKVVYTKYEVAVQFATNT